MVQFTRILAALALMAVSVTVEAAQQQQPAAFSGVVQHEVRELMAEAGSSTGSKGGAGTSTVGDIPAANQPILAQWTAAKAVLQKAFAGEPTLMDKLTAFEAKVNEALKTTISIDAAKKLIGDFLTSLESDPAYAKVEAQLASIKSLLSSNTAGSTGSNSTTASNSTAGSKAGANAAPVGSTMKDTTSNSTAMTPAPSSAASTLVGVAAPAALALAAVFASL